MLVKIKLLGSALGIWLFVMATVLLALTVVPVLGLVVIAGVAVVELARVSALAGLLLAGATPRDYYSQPILGSGSLRRRAVRMWRTACIKTTYKRALMEGQGKQEEREGNA